MIQLNVCTTQNGTYAKQWFDPFSISCIWTVTTTACKFKSDGDWYFCSTPAGNLKEFVKTEKILATMK